MFRINIKSYPDELKLAGLEKKTLIPSYPQYVLQSSNKTNFIARPDKPEKFSIEYSHMALLVGTKVLTTCIPTFNK